MEKRQFAVIGLGVFGSTVATSLSEYGHEVLAVDKDMSKVAEIADQVTKCVQADGTQIRELEMLGLDDFDAVIVGIGEDIEASVLTVLNLKELGVDNIIAKGKTKQLQTILLKLGAKRVVRPEKEMGIKTARSLIFRNIIDMTEIDEDYSLIEINTPAAWVDKSLRMLNVRNVYHINVLGIRKKGAEHLVLEVDPDEIIQEGDRFLVIGKHDAIDKYTFLAK